MNKRIRKLAEEAGFRYIKDDGIGWAGNHNASLPRFAELVRADEREACAKLVEPNEEHRRDASWGYLGGAEGVELLDNIANAIRARGEK